jgi:hypothetical protein
LFGDIQHAPVEAVCKCCAGRSVSCGVVDFSPSGADSQAREKIGPPAGEPIHFFRCEHCGFTFTPALDFSAPIPGKGLTHSNTHAGLIARYFPKLADHKLLDFGSGRGLLEQLLGEQGFRRIRSYDPYSGASDESALTERYRAVLAFEVFEHHVDPRELVKTLASLLDDKGAVLLSTTLVPEDAWEHGIDTSWYGVPRNGHISFFTSGSLALLASGVGMKAASLPDGLHMLFKGDYPEWATGVKHTLCAMPRPAGPF